MELSYIEANKWKLQCQGYATLHIFEFLSSGFSQTQTLQIIANALGCFLDLNNKTLTLKMSHAWVIELGEMKQVLTWKLHPYWLIRLEGAMYTQKRVIIISLAWLWTLKATLTSDPMVQWCHEHHGSNRPLSDYVRPTPQTVTHNVLPQYIHIDAVVAGTSLE